MFDVVEELLVVSRANKGLVGRSMLLGFLFSEAGGWVLIDPPPRLPPPREREPYI